MDSVGRHRAPLRQQARMGQRQDEVHQPPRGKRVIEAGYPQRLAILEGMKFRCLAALAGAAICLFGQSAPKPARARLMRPLVRGTHAAVSSMKPEATMVAQRILDSGGNAFDAAVAGQAVLALVDA